MRPEDLKLEKSADSSVKIDIIEVLGSDSILNLVLKDITLKAKIKTKEQLFNTSERVNVLLKGDFVLFDADTQKALCYVNSDKVEEKRQLVNN